MSSQFLQVEKVTKTFGHFVALEDVSLTIQAGKTTALIGPNGAGKTTFYNVISGRMAPTSGVVKFCGKPISGSPPHKINKSGISRSFQITNVFKELTVLENVMVPLVSHYNLGHKLWQVVNRNAQLESRAMELLDKLGIAQLAKFHAGILSHGDKRLLELAIVLATEPRLVLLDEPTAGMTPDEVHATIELIRKLAASGQYTFFITEHDMKVVFGLAERIIVFHRGKVLAEGSAEEIRSNPEVRTAYLGEESD